VEAEGWGSSSSCVLTHCVTVGNRPLPQFPDLQNGQLSISSCRGLKDSGCMGVGTDVEECLAVLNAPQMSPRITLLSALLPNLAVNPENKTPSDPQPM
jgi:hypothetical protein